MAHEHTKTWTYEESFQCTCCGRRLDKTKMVQLELDQRTWTYHDFGGVPPEKSQGWFPFGKTCAAKKRKEHKQLDIAEQEQRAYDARQREIQDR